MAFVASVQDLSKIYRKPGTNVEVRGAAVDQSRLRRRASSPPSWALSGSGKSTLMNILGCLDQPDQRAVRPRRATTSAS